jgi:hypothetical protein
MKKFQIKYKDTEYTVNAGLKASFIFETLSEKPLQLDTTMDAAIYAYSIMWTGEGFNENWETFIDYCDDNPKFIGDLFSKIPVMGNHQAPQEAGQK